MPASPEPAPFPNRKHAGSGRFTVVHKFGGAPITGRGRMARVASLVSRQKGAQVVVVSALADVTNRLLDAARKGNPGRFTERILRRHMELSPGPGPHEAELERLAAALRKELLSAARRRPPSPRALDSIASYGERMAAPLVGAWLRRRGLPVVVLDGGEAGILTDESHGGASPLPGAAARIRRSLGPHLRAGRVPVVTGFIGRSPRGRVTTLGRGGSDYTATILGAALGAREVWLWKETDGVMSADPRTVPKARLLENLSYEEAMELSYFGAKVLHPRAMEPVMAARIPVRVRSMLRPDSPGTLIGRNGKKRRDERRLRRQRPPPSDGDVVKAVTPIRNVAMLNISGPEMVGTPGAAGRIFTCLGRAGVNVIMISQGSSERTISMLIDEGRLPAALDGLRREFSDRLVRDVEARRDVCAVAAVGEGMAGTPGVAGRLFSALGRARVNVVMIAQGSSEYNISFVVARRDAERAVRVVHDEFR
ncbi:MAG: aspartate kinase [Halobacteria archaeon]